MSTASHHPTTWPLSGLLGGAILYFAAAKLGMAAFGLQPTNLAVFWLPSGIGMVMCLGGGWRAAALVFVASFAANLPGMAHPDPLAHGLHTAVAAGADTLAATLAAAVMRWRLPQGLRQLGQLPGFVLGVCLLPTAASALVLAPNLAWGGYIDAASIPIYAGTLLVADALGLLLVYPLFQAWCTRRQETDPSTGPDWARWLGLTALALATVALGMRQVPGLIYLLVPVLLLVVFFNRNHGAFISLLAANCLVVVMAAQDLGPFHLADGMQSRLALVLFLLATTLVVLGVVLQQNDLLDEASARQRWQQRASHDFLTGLANRERFIQRLDEELQRARRTGRPFALAVIDIDLFKRVNDTHGHQAGDRVLAAFATHLKRLLRNVDLPARIGGEEFAILFPETSLADAVQVVERLRRSVETQPEDLDGVSITTTLTAGVVACNGRPESTTDRLLQAADNLMYDGKRAGRNRVVSPLGTA